MVDVIAVAGRLAAQDPAVKRARNALIRRGCSIREATARAARTTGQGASPAGRKAAKRQKAAERAAARLIVAERTRLARLFTEAALGASLREASNTDLGAVAVLALGGITGARPARPVAEAEVDPRTLSPGDLGRAAVAASAGNSLFWAAGTATRERAPFWKAAAGA